MRGVILYSFNSVSLQFIKEVPVCRSLPVSKIGDSANVTKKVKIHYNNPFTKFEVDLRRKFTDTRRPGLIVVKSCFIRAMRFTFTNVGT